MHVYMSVDNACQSYVQVYVDDDDVKCAHTCMTIVMYACVLVYACVHVRMMACIIHSMYVCTYVDDDDHENSNEMIRICICMCVHMLMMMIMQIVMR
jgi:hypothetical protein